MSRKKSVQPLSPQAEAKKESEKHLAWIAGVFFFMLLIFSLWVINFRDVVRSLQNKNTNSSSFDKIGIKNFTNNFKKSLSEVSVEMKNLQATSSDNKINN